MTTGVIMSDQNQDRDIVAADLKEWETPDLIVEDVRSATRGGTGLFRNLVPPEERITTYYTS